MSKTYRRKNLVNSNNIPDWIFSEKWLNPDELEYYLNEYGDCVETLSYSSWGRNRVDILFGKNSKEGKRRLAKYRSDSDTDNHKRPAGWWVAEFVQRPYRRRARRELHEYMLDNEYEYMIESMPKLGYWN